MQVRARARAADRGVYPSQQISSWSLPSLSSLSPSPFSLPPLIRATPPEAAHVDTVIIDIKLLVGSVVSARLRFVAAAALVSEGQ